ncbi:MAG TPA: signal peptidase II [Spirochaetota bacterium]|mgnify:CR=1 FL=1|nr:signal peptidase II [Spirochaetota bacterium]HPN14147.1 signal peptidase II [Spirochaetota bacterium]HRZ26420.1 signal peptidase II [Spirochaetota bacterium]HSA14956.1 signal peptidase II [Spirochaetota bacterium]
MKRNITALCIVAATLVLDVLTKNFIVDNINLYERHDYLDGFLRITLVYNQGGVFGILQGYKNMFLIVSVIVLALMVAYFFYEKNKSLLFTVSLSLIISGAIGNIIDRLIPGRPGVVDFISVGVDGVYRWPAFNVADSVIVVGACLLVIVFYQEEKRRKALEQQSGE